jgi:hypothetical protein
MKTILHSLVIAATLVITSVDTPKIHGMNYIKNISARIEHGGQNAISTIANSSLWAKFCNYLVKIGKDVDQCESYKGYNSTNLQRSQFSQLESSARKKLIFLTCLQLLGQGLAFYNRVTAPTPYDGQDHSATEKYFDSDTHTPQSFNHIDVHFSSNNKAISKIMPEHDVHFTAPSGTVVGCSLAPDFTLRCCPDKNPSLCRAFNIFDNDSPLTNCCLATSNGTITCSESLCTHPDSIQGLCSLDQQLATPIQCSNTHDNILGDLKSVHNYAMSRISDVDALGDTLDLATGKNELYIEQFIDHITNNLNLEQPNTINQLSIKDRMLPGAHVSRLSPALSIHRGYINFPSFFCTDPIVGHELAHKYQFQSTHRQGPGDEIDADILGGLAILDLNQHSIKHMAINMINVNRLNLVKQQNPFFNLAIEQGAIKESQFEDTTQALICRQKLPIINRINSASIKNLVQIDDYSSPHPDDLVRSTVLFKLDTMIKALLQHFQGWETKEQCPINTNNSTFLT